MNLVKTTAIPQDEVTVTQGIERALASVEATQRELVLLQSQCVGNNNLKDVLQAACSLTNSLSIYGNSLNRSVKELTEGTE